MRKFSLILLMLLFIPSILWAACTNSGADPDGYGTLWTSASASRTDVNACVTAASNGDTIQIPNGSATWTTGISTTKQIIIKAQNITSVSGGDPTGSQNVVIMNNCAEGTSLINLQSGDSYHVGVGGIRFNAPSDSRTNAVAFEGSGSKVPLLWDCYFQINTPGDGTSWVLAKVGWFSLGGVMWNCYLTGEGFENPEWGHSEGGSVVVISPREWTTPSTLGMADTDGTINIYIENCTFKNIGQSPDMTTGARVVIRYSTFHCASGLIHDSGGRHIEMYNNNLNMTGVSCNLSRYFWIREGHGVFTDNVANQSVDIIQMGDSDSPGSDPQPRQPGWGHNGVTDVLDPIYIWNNTGAAGSSVYVLENWQTNINLNEEYYVDSGAKPGYTKYTYPHPLRGGGGTVPSQVQGLTIQGGTIK